MMNVYYIIATIVCILKFIEYKKHRITANNTMSLEVNITSNWLNLKFKTKK